VAGSSAGATTETVTVRGTEPRESKAADEKDEVGGVFGFVKRRAEYDANKVKNLTLRTAGTVQKFLTGRDTVGPDEEPAR
jgi:hypothetical protein